MEIERLEACLFMFPITPIKKPLLSDLPPTHTTNLTYNPNLIFLRKPPRATPNYPPPHPSHPIPDANPRFQTPLHTIR